MMACRYISYSTFAGITKKGEDYFGNSVAQVSQITLYLLTYKGLALSVFSPPGELAPWLPG